MNPTVSLVLVSYRSSARIGAAIRSFRAEADRVESRPEVVVVEHSEDPGEEELVRRLAPDRLIVRPNRGYAAGVNTGVMEAGAPAVLVGNPDIVFQQGSVAALLRALGEGWSIVGPQLELAGFLFPPSDLQTPGELFARLLASRSHGAWRRHLRHEVARWRRVWESATPVGVPTLSGALLGFSRSTFERLGPWDEGYFLYFEETDWLRRAAFAGLQAAVVPGARVTHQWGHTADPGELADVFLNSRRRFLRKHFGVRGRLAAGVPSPANPRDLTPLPEPAPAVAGSDVLWLLSPSLLGFPAAGMRGDGVAPVKAMSAFLAQHGRPQALSLRAVDPRTGRLLGAWCRGPEGR